MLGSGRGVNSFRMARFLGLGSGDNVVTIATDGFDRYPSVLANLAERMGPFQAEQAGDRFEKIFRSSDASAILDVRAAGQKNRLFAAKEEVWKPFGYSQAYLDGMKSQTFWDAEFDKIGAIDAAFEHARVV